MAENEFQKLKDQLVEQKITKQQIVTAGSTETVSIKIPRDKKVFLKGYGYSWFSTNEYTLSTGNRQFPTGSDQQGSPSIPMIFGNPFPCRAGGDLKLTITNNDGSDHTYDVVFYILTNDHLDETSTGGELILATGGASGIASTVAITDSTGLTYVSVINDGTYKRLAVDTEVTVVDVFGNKTPTHSVVTVGSATTVVLAVNTARKGALFINDSDEVMYLKFGASAVMNQAIRLNANGGSYEMSQELGNNVTSAVNGICTSGSKLLLVTEFA